MRCASFFIVRSPLLEGHASVDPTDCLSRPQHREAIDRASHALVQAAEGERGREPDVLAAVTRYLERMRGRATPFSLMAGYSIGRVGGDRTGVEFSPRAEYLRVVRVDIDAVSRLVRAQASAAPDAVDWVVRRDLVVLPDTLRVCARADGGEEATYSDVVRTPALDRVLALSKQPVRLAALSTALAEFARDAGEARAYVEALVAHGILIPAATPGVLVLDELSTLDAIPELASVAASARAARSTPLGTPFDGVALCQGSELRPDDLIYDLVKPTQRAELGAPVMRALGEVVEALQRVTIPMVDPRLETFVTDFRNRYEGREVPLLEALDPKRGLTFPHAARVAAGRTLRPWLMDCFERACRAGAGPLVLTQADLPPTVQWTPPESFAVRFSLALDPLCIHGPTLSPAPGSALFARAAAVHPEPLLSLTTEFLRGVAAREPDVDFVDVSYFLQGRSAAFTQYPLLQPRELTLTAATTDVSRSLDPNDVLVSVVDGMPRLRSRTTGRVLRVRPTGAANPGRPDVTDVFRFLYALGRASAPGYAWSWGPFELARSLPEVRYGDHVLSQARWRLSKAETNLLRAARGTAARWDAAQTLRAARGLPRHVHYAEEADLLLPIDLDDRWSVAAWVDVAKDEMTLLEAFPLERSAVRGPEGPYHHEIVVPMVGKAAKASPATAERLPMPAEVTFDRVVPGGAVLFLAFWGDADELLPTLAELVEEVVEPLSREGVARHWFFLPYSDPDPHVRVRLFGDPEALWSARVLGAVHAFFEGRVRSRSVRRVSFETYDRETYRYGGPEGTEVAERMFALSSQVALSVHEDHDVFSEGDELKPVLVAAARTHLALLEATSLPLVGQREIAVAAAARFGASRPRTAASLDGSALFRELRASLVDRRPAQEVLGVEAAAAMRSVLAEARQLVSDGRLARPFGLWMTDCMHVHSVRIFTTWHPVDGIEALVYELVAKALASLLHVGASAAGAPTHAD